MSYYDEIISKDVVKEIRELRKAYEKNAEKEQMVAATVQMSLADYIDIYEERDALRREIESLKAARDAVSILLSKIDIPIEELKIKPDSVYYERREDVIDLHRQHIITFKTDGGK